MTKRVLGVLAALLMGGSALACSSSNAPIGAGTDGGIDAKGDVKEAGPDTRDTAPPAKVWPQPGTVGKECTSAEDCDPDAVAEDFAICANLINPTPICVLGHATEDSCDMGDGKTIPFCDKGNIGLCTKSGTNPAECSAMCVLGTDGTWATKCAGTNTCGIELSAKDDAGKTSLIGTCSGGCAVDTDCKGPGAKCDPVLNYCLPGCASDTDCAKYSVKSPLWKCNLTRKVCTWNFPKVLGEACATQDDCICFKNTADAGGYCTQYCQTGKTDCGTGYTCDTLINKADMAGAPVVTWTSAPAGLGGYCLKNCTADTDCVTGQVCDVSGGATQKTCRPKPAA